MAVPDGAGIIESGPFEPAAAPDFDSPRPNSGRAVGRPPSGMFTLYFAASFGLRWRGRLQTRGKEMYAVIRTGGKQYKVAVGEKVKVEQIAADVGQEVVLDQVLALGNGAELKVGTPVIGGATVKATVVSHGLHPKIRIFKMRRRKHYQRHGGHRQSYTELQIGSVNA